VSFALLGALVVGAAFGYGAQRGAFCLNSGFRAALEGEWTKVKALALAVAAQLIVLPAIFTAGLARPAELPLPLLAAVTGGLLFGVSMRWAGGCAAGVWYKLGAGDMGSLLAILGMASGAAAADAGPLVPLRTVLQNAIPNAASWIPPVSISLLAGLMLLVGLSRLEPGCAGEWDWRKTGIWVGMASTLAWPASALAERHFGLAVVPGTTALVSVVAGNSGPVWDLVLVLGVLMGGWLAARSNGVVALRAPSPQSLAKRFAGGIGLGVGASIATGCTVGQGLTGLALLAPSSFAVMAAIFAGSALAEMAARRFEAGGHLVPVREAPSAR
jgi:uncharacterized membrane protein YedE/YeeE